MDERELDLRNRNVTGRRRSFFIDYTMLFVVIILAIFGLLMVYSTTAYKSGISEFRSQLICILIGLGLMFFEYKLAYPLINGIGKGKIAFAAGIFALVCIIALKTPLGATINGATRWIKVGSRFTIQVAEIVKIAVILIMAALFSSFSGILKSWKGVGITLLIPAFLGGLLGIVSNNMSSAIIIFGIAMVMMFVTSRRYKIYMLLVVAVAVLVLGAIIVFSSTSFGGFRGARIRVWLNPELTVEGVDNYQTKQALYAIGSGGIWGKGIGESIQKMNRLPEAENDMIYAILCEELGLFGGLIVIVLFTALITRLITLAAKCTKFYDSMIVTGVMAHIMLQSILNIAVVTNSIPNTGVALPFISSGGSSVLCLLFEIGLVLAVTKNLNENTEEN